MSVGVGRVGGKHVQVFAVVRLELDLDPSPMAVKVKEVLLDSEQAEAEVQRLNQLGTPRTMYFWQATRLYGGPEQDLRAQSRGDSGPAVD